MDISVVVATYGDRSWVERAAIAASTVPDGVEVVQVHGPALHLARNWGAMRATGEWLCFLDADDELTPGYFDAMSGNPDELLAPVLELVHPDGSTERPDLTVRDIDDLNPCCIGTLIHRDVFVRVGGFWDEPAWEDWSLFLRAVRAGARIRHVADAVYRAHVRHGSRNHRPGNPRLLREQILTRTQEYPAA